MSAARNYITTYPVNFEWNSCNINFAVQGMPNLFLITTYQASKLFHSQSWFIFSFTGHECFLRRFYIFKFLYCCLEIFFAGKVLTIILPYKILLEILFKNHCITFSWRPAGEPVLPLGSKGSPYIRSNIWLISNSNSFFAVIVFSFL